MTNLPGNGIHLDAGYILGDRPALDRLAFQDFQHNPAPNWRRPGNTGSHGFHPAVIVIADPNADDPVRRPADRPVIPLVIGRSGFDRHLLVGDFQQTIGPKSN